MVDPGGDDVEGGCGARRGEGAVWAEGGEGAVWTTEVGCEFAAEGGAEKGLVGRGGEEYHI